MQETLYKAVKGFCFFIVIGLCGSGLARAQSASASSQVESGAKVYQQWCVECHNDRGFGTASLERRYHGTVPANLEQRRDLNGALIRYVVRNGMSFMPFFRKTEVSDQELDALSAYLSSDPALRPRLK
jgi:mono/diheme cytochrome c family protein